MFAFIFLLAFLALLFFTVSLLFAFKNYKDRFQVDYNPKNMFPYELNFEMKFKENLIANTSLIILMVVEAIFYITFKRSLPTDGVITLIFIMGLISSILLPFIYLTPLKALNAHLAIDVFFFITNFMTLGAIGVHNLIEYQIFLNNANIVLAVVCFTFVIGYIVMMLNPKLSLWSKMEKVTNSDGTSYFKRPKYFPLAYTEWLVICVNIINVILTFISYLI